MRQVIGCTTHLISAAIALWTATSGVAHEAGLDSFCKDGLPLPQSLPEWIPRPGTEHVAPLVIDVPDAERNAATLTATCLYRQVTVEVVLMADYTAAYGAAGAYARAVSLMEQVNVIYHGSSPVSPPDMNIRLLRVHVYVGADPFSNSTDSETFLASLSSWRQANITTPGLGTVVGLTARDIDFSGVGVGYVGSMCNVASVAVQEDRPSGCNHFGSVTAYIARIIGQTFGMTNDNSPCTTSGFIMQSSATCGNPPSQFSTCSIAALNAFLASPNASCVVSVPALPRGDLNCDCNITFADVDPFVLGLIDPITYQNQHPTCPLSELGDMNADALVNGLDIPQFLDALTP